VVSNGPEPVTIPDFVGMTVDKAKMRAQQLGITLDTSQSVPGTPPDTIASQDPASGTKLDRNAIVHVVVNSGASAQTSSEPNGPTATLPSVVNADLDDAVQAVQQAGFPFTVRYVQQSANNGKVVAQIPPAGQVPQGETVTLMLSVSGEVPDTVGLSPDDAAKLLRSYGYTVAKKEYTTSLGAGGKAVATEPAAGSALAPGSSVTLTINGTPP
jgi:serine/threonine-protein kinase